jgi:meso-butanediol dehydrogenase / (S,S)-butanediol dehydrogenase / diacetyl reductase
MKRFEDKTILVTGAGSGIGAACVRRLFAEGASIAAADLREEEVDKVVAEFGNSDRIYDVGVDVSDRDQVAAFVSGAVRRFGKLDGLVNTPASGVSATFWIPIPRFGARSCRSTSRARSTCARLSPVP